MTIYACISGGIVVAQITVADPVDGVGPPPPSGVDGDYDQVSIIPAKISRPAGASDTLRLHWNDGAPEFRETAALADMRERKALEMSEACAAAILAGFTSAALGAEHHYPAKLTDQSNLAGSIIDSLIPCPPDWQTPFWCADAADDWQFRLHTATQIQQVGRDGKAAILAAMTRNEVLRGQIATATMAELDAIRWAE